ncbi:hypothetical protein ALC57_15717 [Trachymyrmex cornetzi]|uniref:Uncharacterized protein n=1 Tax=Trachymyrmex cornetzi TaxID=471704 RepID=A0A151IWC4_9HYME|nr:hypothetical protein ALC57_15717 [Trachymyrmex cornetzi]
MTMTETTLRRVFAFDGCIDVTFERLVRLVDTVDVKYTRFSNIASEDATGDSDIINGHQLVDCELLALIFNTHETKTDVTISRINSPFVIDGTDREDRNRENREEIVNRDDSDNREDRIELYLDDEQDSRENNIVVNSDSEDNNDNPTLSDDTTDEICYLSKRSTTHLQIEFNTIKQKSSENARQYGLRVDNLSMELMVRRLITEAVLEEDEAVVYVKEHEKREWLADMLDTDDIIVETLDAHYKDVESLSNLDDCNTIRCGKHAKNCALQNVFKIFNWWSRHQEEL